MKGPPAELTICLVEKRLSSVETGDAIRLSQIMKRLPHVDECDDFDEISERTDSREQSADGDVRGDSEPAIGVALPDLAMMTLSQKYQ